MQGVSQHTPWAQEAPPEQSAVVWQSWAPALPEAQPGRTALKHFPVPGSHTPGAWQASRVGQATWVLEVQTPP